MRPGSQMCHLLHMVRTIMGPGVLQRGSHTVMLRPHTSSRMVDLRRSTDGIRPLRLRLHSSNSILRRRLLASLYTRASCTNVSEVPAHNHKNNTSSAIIRNKCNRVKTLMFRPVIVPRSRRRLQPQVLLLHPFLPWPCLGGQSIIETHPKSLLAPRRCLNRSNAPTRGHTSRLSLPHGHRPSKNPPDSKCGPSRGRGVVPPP